VPLKSPACPPPEKKKTPPLPEGRSGALSPSIGSNQNWKFSVPMKARGLPIWTNGTEYWTVEPPVKPPT